MVEQNVPGRGDVKDDINGDCCPIRLLCLVTITRERCPLHQNEWDGSTSVGAGQIWKRIIVAQHSCSSLAQTGKAKQNPSPKMDKASSDHRGASDEAILKALRGMYSVLCAACQVTCPAYVN